MVGRDPIDVIADVAERFSLLCKLHIGKILLDVHVLTSRQYNRENQRTDEVRADSSIVGYGYDHIGQLTIADSSVPAEDRGYFYDAAWNLNRRTNNGVTGTFTVDNLNQLTGAPCGSPFNYDGNGNMISNFCSFSALTYDSENRLIMVSGDTYKNFRSTFAYDGLGRLRKRIDFQWQVPPPAAPSVPPPASGGSWVATNTVLYIYDGWRVIQERDTNSTPTVSYTRGNDLSVSLEGAGGIGGLLARSSGYSGGNWTSHADYYADGNGNITSLIDDSQNVVASYRYDPFGNIISKTGTLADANVYRFSSKEVHVASGMYYYGFRFYEPNLQRWINRDPMDESGGINLYGFVLNSPLALIDDFGAWPTGLYGAPQVHQASIDRVLNFLSPAERNIIKDQQKVADEDQSTGCSYKHAMRAPGQSVAEATDLANDYVRKSIKTARSLEKQGRHDEALQALGDAMHTLQDATSPMHKGFQQWDGLGSLGKLRKAKRHTDGENYDPGPKSSLDDATLKAWQYFQGEPMPKDCFK